MTIKERGQDKDVGNIYAVDYDGTLDFAGFPDVSKIDFRAVEVLKKLQSEGNKIILWTCRFGKYLDAAVSELLRYKFNPDAINENIEEVKALGLKSPKVVADYYIDDRAMGYDDLEYVWDMLSKGE